jgi:hypothetical protein
MFTQRGQHRKSGIHVAHILIAASNQRYRRTLADMLTVAGHHIVLTSDTTLAVAALRLSQHRLIALLSDVALLLEPRRYGVPGIASGGKTRTSGRPEQCANGRHLYILLTTLSPDKLSAAWRVLQNSGKALIMRPDCSIGALLAAVEMADEQLSASPAHGSIETATSCCG